MTLLCSFKTEGEKEMCMRGRGSKLRRQENRIITFSYVIYANARIAIAFQQVTMSHIFLTSYSYDYYSDYSYHDYYNYYYYYVYYYYYYYYYYHLYSVV
jgi:hypothetical protein